MTQKRILVVEDDAVGRQVIADFLESRGYTVSVATNGVEGLQKFDDEHPDLVLADVMLPRKNGFEMVFDLKRTEQGKETPVLLMSAVCKDVHAECYAVVDLKAQGFLAKPFKMRQLLEHVQSLIGS